MKRLYLQYIFSKLIIVVRGNTGAKPSSKKITPKIQDTEVMLSGQDTSNSASEDEQPFEEDRRDITLAVHNLDDVDEDLLKDWVKTVTGVWPSSIHIADSGEKAVVKLAVAGERFGKLNTKILLFQPVLPEPIHSWSGFLLLVTEFHIINYEHFVG